MENKNHKKKMSPAKRRRKRINKAFRIAGEILVGIQVLLTLVFIGFFWRLGMVPTKLLAGLGAILLVFAALLFTMQVVTRGKAIVSKLVSIIMSSILALGSMYLYKTHDAVLDISGDSLGKQVNSVLVAVLKDDPAEKITDTKDYIYGIQHNVEENEIDHAIEKINEEVGAEIMIAEYNTLNEQAAALLDGSVGAIVYNEGYGGILDEVHEGFSSQIRIIGQYSIEGESEDSHVLAGVAADVNVQNDTFHIYISGIDVYGPVSSKSRSDVNIVATVNPTTKQILLTNTPRDYYLPIPGVSGEGRDKLTHAGIYGVEKSMATLGELYGIEIPFYARVNFTSLITMVDSMNGIDVMSESTFTTNGDGGVVISVQEGMNHFNGKQALAFARERYSLPGGDNQRGRNQMAVIQAMFKKMLTPEMLMKAPTLIAELSDSVETNMAMDQIQSLIQSQISSGGDWTLKSVAAEGTGDSQYCYSMPGTALYVMQPNMDTVENIRSLMQKVEDGEKLTE